MLHMFLVLAVTLAGTAVALAGPLPALARAPACRTGVQHVSLLSASQMCPRPLATTVIARPRHGTRHT